MADTENATAANGNPADVKPVEVTGEAQPTNETKAGGDDSKDADNDTKKAGYDKREHNGRRDNRGRNHDNRGGWNRNGGDHKRNKKRSVEYESLPETDDPVMIRNQVEFYFSNSNLATDQHMFYSMEGPKNKPIEISHLHTFMRMRRFQPRSAVVAALRESDDLIVVDDGPYSGAGNEAVKRKFPLEPVLHEGESKSALPSVQELFRRHKALCANMTANSIYFKGFGGEDAGQIALEKFFKPYGGIMIRKRRQDDREETFKGSVFVEFRTVEEQQQFLALDPKPKWKDNENIVMSKQAYIDMKCKEKGITPDDEKKRRERYSDFKYKPQFNGRDGNSRNGRRDGRYRTNQEGKFQRSRKPRDSRRRDRSGSRDSVDSRDWNDRRDRFQNGKDDRAAHKDEESKGIERDEHGVPVVKDTRGEDKKRKANDELDRNEDSKKSKIEIKEDE